METYCGLCNLGSLIAIGDLFEVLMLVIDPSRPQARVAMVKVEVHVMLDVQVLMICSLAAGSCILVVLG